MVSPAGSGADGDMSGTVDTADYEFWRARFGNVAPIPGAVSSAVPEASTTTLVVIGLLLCHLTLRRFPVVSVFCQ
jgi:hypothetical protein